MAVEFEDEDEEDGADDEAAVVQDDDNDETDDDEGGGWAERGEGAGVGAGRNRLFRLAAWTRTGVQALDPPPSLPPARL